MVTPSAAVMKAETVESCASRRTTSSRVAAMAAASAAPWRSRARRARRAASSAVSRMRTSASGATTVVMSRPSATMPRPAERAPGAPDASASISARWRRHSSARTARLVATVDTTAVSAGLADGGGDVGAGAHHARVGGVGDHLQRHGLDGGGDPVGVGQVDALVLAPPRGGAVHGAGVEVGQPELGGQALGDGGLARSPTARRSPPRARARSGLPACSTVSSSECVVRRLVVRETSGRARDVTF